MRSGVGTYAPRDAAVPLEARTARCLVDIALARHQLAEAGETLAALSEDAERSAFVALACDLLDRVQGALDQASTIVSAVPELVDEEAQERLRQMLEDALLIRAATAVGAPQA